MAKSFTKLKDPKLGLLDIITIGKYKGCRVDSIIDINYEYLIYMDRQRILSFRPEVLDRLKNKFSASSIEVSRPRIYYDSYDQINGYVDNYEDNHEAETVYFADGSGYVPASGPCGPLYFDYNGNT